MPFDFVSALIVIMLAGWFQILPPGHSRVWGGTATGLAIVSVATSRFWSGPGLAMDVAAVALLVGLVITFGAEIVVRSSWPPGSFVAAIIVVTAVGAYTRAYELSSTLQSSEPLQPDVRYYEQQAFRTFNPFAAGQKSPLWPAMNAPLVRQLQDPDNGMRLLSWWFGILMIPAVAIGIGRLFEPVVGILVAGSLAVDSFLVDLCTKGLREEFGICLWMAVLWLLFGERRSTRMVDGVSVPATGTKPGAGSQQFSWLRVFMAGLASGALLLLRNTDTPILIVLVVYAVIRTRTPSVRAIVAVLLPIAIVAPFYVNQWRAYGDAFYLEKRDTRYHANFEFVGRQPPAGLTVPTREEFDRDLYTGEPLSPAAYLFKYHTLREVAGYQWAGLKRVALGESFSAGTSLWMGLICAAGITATLLTARQRFAALFFLGSVLGIRAHIMAATGFFEERLLLPVLVIWLAAGWWVLASAARAGLRRWLAFSRPIDTTTPEHPQGTSPGDRGNAPA